MQVIFYAGGIAFLTVLLNGSTISYTMELLGMLNANPAEDTLISYVRQVTTMAYCTAPHCALPALPKCGFRAVGSLPKFKRCFAGIIFGDDGALFLVQAAGAHWIGC